MNTQPYYITDAQHAILQSYLTNNDRTGFYIALHEMTGSESALYMAEISSSSDLLGGVAWLVNDAYAGNLPGYPPQGVEWFSMQVALADFGKFQEVPGTQTWEVPSDIGMIENARAAWDAIGSSNLHPELGEYFPGNVIIAQHYLMEGDFATAQQYLTPEMLGTFLFGLGGGIWEGFTELVADPYNYTQSINDYLDSHPEATFDIYTTPFGVDLTVVKGADGRTIGLVRTEGLLGFAGMFLDGLRNVTEPFFGYLNELGSTIGTTLPQPGELRNWFDLMDQRTQEMIDALNDLFDEAEDTVSPLILDLDGDGVETLNIESGVHFDHDANGLAESTGWAGEDDGLLVWDRNANGQIDSGRELFGNNTLRPNGSVASNGFAALADLDSNLDNQISSSDSAFSSLRIWRDLDSDAHVDAGELLTLSAAGVQSIGLTYTPESTVDANGNQHRQVGLYTRTNGEQRHIDDVWFTQNRTATIDVDPAEIPADVRELPQVQGFGNVRSLRSAMVLDTSGQLRALVEAYAAETDPGLRAAMLNPIIFKWAGVDGLSPSSRGAYVSDARTLYAIEAFSGRQFVQGSGVNAGTSSPGPNAAGVLAEAYATLSGFVESRLLAQVYFGDLYDGLTLEWSGPKLAWNVDATLASLASAYAQNATQGAQLLHDFIASLESSGEAGRSVIALLRSAGDLDGNDLEVDLASSGFASVLVGGPGNDVITGGAGDDLLSGGAGDDTLSGGAGSDTYRFGIGSGHDTITNYDTSIGRFDSLLLGGGIGIGSILLSRAGDNLLLNLGMSSDSLTITNFFFGQTAGGYALDAIRFANGEALNLIEINQQVQTQGTEGWDFLYAYPTDTTLHGFGGDDWIDGGAGNDVLFGDEGDDDVYAGAGDDVLFGGDGDDNLRGESGADVLDGGAGSDLVEGGTGNDVYRFGRSSDYDEVFDKDGIDRIELAEGVLPGDVTLVRSSSSSRMMGTFDDALVLILDGSADQVYIGSHFTPNGTRAIEEIRFADGTVWDAGDIAAYTQDQSGSVNTQVGTSGDDSFVVDHSSDLISGAGGGTDSVTSNVSYTLPTDVEHLTLTGSLALSGGGNSLNNTITGNAASNSLGGGAGADILIGGAGDDTYSVDGPEYQLSHDTVIENAGEGYDTIIGTWVFDVTLPDNVEAMAIRTAGHHSIEGQRVLTGNALDNVIDVSEANANQWVVFRLDGGTGADILIGGYGAQVYVIDNALDVVQDFEGVGDIIESSVSYSLPQNIGTLVLTGTAATTATGNASNNRLDGSQNSAANVLVGGEGNDTYIVDQADVIVEGATDGTDNVEADFSFTLQEHVENLVLTGTDATTATGNASDNVLDGSQNSAANVLIGGLGDDTYVISGVNSFYGAADTVVEYAAEGTDTIIAFDPSSSYFLGEHVENGVSLSYGVKLYGNTLNNVLTSGAGTHWTELWGGTGSDTLIALAHSGPNVIMRGGEGADVYRIWAGSGDSAVIQDTDPGALQDAAVDVVEFDASLTPTGVAFSRTENHYDLLVLLQTGARFVVSGFFQDGDAHDRIELFQFSNGISLTDAQVAQGLVISGTAGADTLVAVATGSDLLGLGGADTLTGGAGNDLLDGGEGADVMAAGLGHDLYRVDDAGDVVSESANAGTDTVESSIGYALGANVENLTLLGSADIDGYGTDAANVVRGNLGSNTLYGQAGNDTIDGGGGDDTLIGGLGQDIYVVDSALDVVVEQAGEGGDIVRAHASYVLPEHVEHLELVEGSAALNATGNSAYNNVQGNSLNNVIDGGGGGDQLYGWKGDDTYIVDDSGDSPYELASEGIDTIVASVSWTLFDEFENLVLTGADDIDGTGNGVANSIVGNSGINALSGGAGDDTLDGGGGGDTLRGGQGNDTYWVKVGDTTSEFSNQGTDLVYSSISWTLTSNIEQLTLLGSADITGTGNNLANTLIGNAGNNTLSGGTGADSMSGAAGNDTYVVDNAGDTVTELAGEGTDLVQANVSFTLSSEVENLTLTAGTTGTGNALNNSLIGNGSGNTLTGHGGNDTLDGMGGSDTMVGGAGDDVYIVGQSGDVTTEAAGEGLDRVESAVARDLSTAANANIEILFITSSSTLNGVGNGLDNLLRGGGGTNTLSGNAGVDILEGGGGTDTLNDSGGKTLFNGGAAADTITSGAANDLLIGGAGNDALTTGTGADLIVFNLGDGQDTVAVSTTKDNTVSIGGGALYADLVFQKTGNNLILKVGASDQITFTNFYAAAANHSVNTLQVIIEDTTDYDAGSGDATRNKKVESFDFEGLVTAFTASGLTTWALTNALTAQHLSGSDTAALGGDLAYRYGRFGNLADISFTPATGILADAAFGASAQSLQALGSLQDTSPRLS
jgi:trimeric autotransporter adhesin